MTTTASELQTKGQAAKRAARELARASTEVKNSALNAIADALPAHSGAIVAANEIDLSNAREMGLESVWIDRLKLDSGKIEAIARDTHDVALAPDPIGEMTDARTLPNGLQIGRRRVPLGVIAAIYESRPNVTVDIAALCLKSGNACILRGGKEAINSNRTIAGIVRDAVASAGAPTEAVQLIEDTDRSIIADMLAMKDVIDLVVPRGGMELINFVAENARMPVLIGGRGVVHTYVDASADIAKAVPVVNNAKVRKISNCNALDTLLVHGAIAPAFLPAIGREWAGKVEVHADDRAASILRDTGVALQPVEDLDWDREWLAMAAGVRIVDSLDEALEHIHLHGTGHSDAIITEDYSNAMRFLNEVDTAVCYVNASTQFTDGAQFGLGAEIIDSTQKTIARGPVGLREITSYKWIVFGDGHTRP